MVQVGHRKDYPRFLACLFVEPHGVVLDSTELASVVGAFKDAGAYLLPVLRVAVAVFGSYRHGSIFFGVQLLEVKYYRLVDALYQSVGERHAALERLAEGVGLFLDLLAEVL